MALLFQFEGGWSMFQFRQRVSDTSLEARDTADTEGGIMPRPRRPLLARSPPPGVTCRGAAGR